MYIVPGDCVEMEDDDGIPIEKVGPVVLERGENDDIEAEVWETTKCEAC